jgi:hypothetical protein
MARTNLHEVATRLLDALKVAASGDRFEGKLRTVAADAGLNSVRSAEAVKLLEDLGRIEVVQRGRRGRDTIIAIRSPEPVTLEDAEGMLPSKSSKRPARLNYEDIGRAVVDRLIELSRDDALRAAQVEAFASQSDATRKRISDLEEAVAGAEDRETQLRIKLRAAEDALSRAEDNLQRAFGSRPADRGDGNGGATSVPDEDAQAVLEILRSGRG